MWVASATYPLSESEILQALSVEHGSQDFPDLQRQAWLDTRRACGPIIENANGVVQFVHFTAKEYLIIPCSKHSTTFSPELTTYEHADSSSARRADCFCLSR